jgi:hypothetical protein
VYALSLNQSIKPSAGSFIVGYSVAGLGFGHAVHLAPPFKLMAVGLAIWCGAVVLRCVCFVSLGCCVAPLLHGVML